MMYILLSVLAGIFTLFNKSGIKSKRNTFLWYLLFDIFYITVSHFIHDTPIWKEGIVVGLFDFVVLLVLILAVHDEKEYL